MSIENGHWEGEREGKARRHIRSYCNNQTGENGCLGIEGSSNNGEKWLDYILKLECASMLID